MVMHFFFILLVFMKNVKLSDNFLIFLGNMCFRFSRFRQNWF